jgi:hypothetical protein
LYRERPRDVVHVFRQQSGRVGEELACQKKFVAGASNSAPPILLDKRLEYEIL